MKKIMMLFLALILFNVKDVFAQDQYKLTLEKQDGIYFSRRGANYNDDSYPYYLYKFGNIFAYCIEPGKHITTYTYVGEEEYVDLGFSEELKEKLELIGFYGRDYPGHDNIRYSMATQALIWELTGVDTVTFWTKQNEQGEEIDVTKERNEIMNLVNNHKILPKFETHYYGNLAHEIRINDPNNVLNGYEVSSSGAQEVYIEDNTLVIMPRTVGIFDIELRRREYSDYKTIIFVGKSDSTSQKIARLHYTKEIKTSFTIVIDGISLKVQKVDENNNPIKRENMKFKVRDLIRNKDVCSGLPNCIHTTSDDGWFFTEPLDYGEYEIEEVEDQLIEGYTWNSNKLRIILDESTEFNYDEEYYNYAEYTFTNNSVKGYIEINKKGEEMEIVDNEIDYHEVILPNIEFELYNNDTLIKTITTDNNGYAKVDDLTIGDYYLKEKTKLDNYIELETIPVEIKQDNQYQTNISVSLNIKNELKKGTLEFTKEDLVTSEGIPNTIIEIYNDDNELLFTKETDDAGKVVINDLPIGKYYIIEKEANSLYLLTNEKVYFEIKNNGEIIKAKMTNEKKEVPVVKTKTKEDIIAHSLFGIVFLIGIGRGYYEKKYSY